jgi:hypothetical protein
MATRQPPSPSPVLPAARHGRAMPPMTAGRGLMPAAKLSRAAPGPPSLFPIFPSMRRRTPGPPAPFFLSARAIGPLKRSRRSLTSPPSPHFSSPSVPHATASQLPHRACPCHSQVASPLHHRKTEPPRHRVSASSVSQSSVRCGSQVACTSPSPFTSGAAGPRHQRHP